MNYTEFYLSDDPRWPAGYPAWEIVRELEVNPESPSGLSWRRPGKGRRKNLFAGCLNQRAGYWAAGVGSRKRFFPCHRLVLLLSGIFPEPGQYVVDHIDKNRSNNVPENLRWSTYAENNKNRKDYSKIKLATWKYASWIDSRCKFLANYRNPYTHVMVNLGYYDDPYEAHLVAVAHKLENCWNP